MSQSNDYYQILGLSRQSSQEEIRKAYRKLAMKWHPDRNEGSVEATEQFKKITEAYDVLSNANKKGIYDRDGKDGLNQNGMHFNGANAFNIFQQFFGRSSPFESNAFPFPFPFEPQQGRHGQGNGRFQFGHQGAGRDRKLRFRSL